MIEGMRVHFFVKSINHLTQAPHTKPMSEIVLAPVQEDKKTAWLTSAEIKLDVENAAVREFFEAGRIYHVWISNGDRSPPGMI